MQNQFRNSPSADRSDAPSSPIEPHAHGNRGAHRGSRSRLVRDLFSAGLAALFPFWVIGQIARDDFWITGLCFYIPSVFLAGGLVVCSALQLQARRPRLAKAAALLALLPLSMVVLVENRLFAAQPEKRGQFRMVHWNVGGGLGKRPMRQELIAQRADLYLFSEISRKRSIDDFREGLGDGYQTVTFAGMAIVGAGKLQGAETLIDRPRTKVHAVTWEFLNETFLLFLVDLPSEIRVARDPLLREINALIERYKPDIVVGDFNAPRRSRALCHLPEGYSHAYESAGSGVGYTWPVPFPMYSLDHCIYAKGVVPARYALHSSIYSDHRLQVFDFSLSH